MSDAMLRDLIRHATVRASGAIGDCAQLMNNNDAYTLALNVISNLIMSAAGMIDGNVDMTLSNIELRLEDICRAQKQMRTGRTKPKSRTAS